MSARGRARGAGGAPGPQQRVLPAPRGALVLPRLWACGELVLGAMQSCAPGVELSPARALGLSLPFPGVSQGSAHPHHVLSLPRAAPRALPVRSPHAPSPPTLSLSASRATVEETYGKSMAKLAKMATNGTQLG